MNRVGGVLLGALTIVAAYVAAFIPHAALVSAWLLCFGLALLLPSLLFLAMTPDSSSGRRGRVAIVLVLAVVLLGGLGGALVPATENDRALLFGLPRRTALLLYGVGLLPGLVFGVAYAIGFNRLVLDRDRLEALRKEMAPDRNPDRG